MFEKALHYPRYELPENYPVPKKLNLHAHNTYLEVASEMGIIGLGAFIFIFGYFFFKARRRLANPLNLTQDERAIFTGLTASILAVLEG